MASSTSVNVSITAEQAAILLPLHDQISTTTTVPDLSTPSLNTSNSTTTDYYSANELLKKKAKNGKLSAAQGCLLVIKFMYMYCNLFSRVFVYSDLFRECLFCEWVG